MSKQKLSRRFAQLDIQLASLENQKKIKLTKGSIIDRTKRNEERGERGVPAISVPRYVAPFECPKDILQAQFATNYITESLVMILGVERQDVTYAKVARDRFYKSQLRFKDMMDKLLANYTIDIYPHPNVLSHVALKRSQPGHDDSIQLSEMAKYFAQKPSGTA